MYPDPGHPQERDNVEHPAAPVGNARPDTGLTRECLIGLLVLLATLGLGWLFPLTPF